eukprot:84878_1
MSKSVARHYTQLSNYEATQLINKLNSKHRNNKAHIDATIRKSFEVYDRVQKREIDSYVINALLRLWWDYRNASQIMHIWNDIQLFHDHIDMNRAQLSYSSIMKCLLFPTEIDIHKCIQTLQWMEHCRYSLSIHDAFLNKLILKCGEHKRIDAVTYIHTLIKRNIIQTKQHILGNHTALIGAYGACGHVDDAWDVFNSISDAKDVVMIGAMMKVLLDHNHSTQALQLFDKYPPLMHNHVTNILAIKACMHCNDLHKAMTIKADHVRVQAALIDMYGHFKDHQRALDTWDSIHADQRNAVCLGSIMKALMSNGRNEEALQIYDDHNALHNTVTHLLAIKACANSKQLEKGISIHHVLNAEDLKDTFVVSALMDLYGKCGSMNEAEAIFNSFESQHIGIIDCMMSVYIANGGNKQALYLYDKSKSNHDNISHVLALKACINANDFDKGLRIHSVLGHASDIFIQTALIDFYGKFGHIQSAADIFFTVSDELKTIVVVNAMMEAYIHCDLNHEAVNLFTELNDLEPDLVSYRTVFKACSRNATLVEYGEALHTKLLHDEHIIMDTEVASHLIHMYGECGMMDECEAVLSLFTANVTIYKAMLHVYAMIGDIDKAKTLFDQIPENAVDMSAYIRLLKCCATAGDVDMAQYIWYERMDDDMKHNEHVMSAFVDCMARKGLLEEALEFMMSNKYEYESGWLSLLSACRKYSDIQTAERVYDVMNGLFELNRDTMSSASVLMSNSYASQGEYDKQNAIRERMQQHKWYPKQAKSEMNVNGLLHVFQSGAGIDEIYFNNNETELYHSIDAKLNEIVMQLKEKYDFEHDYTMLTRKCDTDWIKNNELKRHSEKQALAFAILNSACRIIIKNNLRICNDCHTFMKAVAKLLQRQIIVSDPNRVHVFDSNGTCNCCDYY